MSDEITYEELLRIRGRWRKPSEEAKIIAALKPGEWHCFGEVDVATKNRIGQAARAPRGYPRSQHPERRYVTRTVGDQFYVICLKPEDIK